MHNALLRTLCIVFLAVFGSACKESDASSTELSAWSWLPSPGRHTAELADVQKDAQLTFAIPDDAPLKTHSETPGGISPDGSFVPREEKSIVVDSGVLESSLGPITKRAHWGGWTWIWDSAKQDKKMDWGYTLTRGELILPRSSFLDPPTDMFAENSFQIEPFGPTHVLIRLDPTLNHSLCVLRKGPLFDDFPFQFIPTAGFIGSKATVDGQVFERKSDGWCLGDERRSN